jgi:DNA-directed RNA polymerase specialized sigma24 family protein
MESKNLYTGILPYAVKTVRYWASRLTKHPVFISSDLEDLEQDLMLELHRRLPNFNSSKSSLATFIARVVANCAASLIKQAKAEKRGGGFEIISLNNKITTDQNSHPIELIEVIASDQALWADQKPHWSNQVTVHIDMNHIIGELPHSLSLVAQYFFFNTIPEIMNNTGISRFCLKKSLASIKQAFVKAGYCKATIYHNTDILPVM